MGHFFEQRKAMTTTIYYSEVKEDTETIDLTGFVDGSGNKDLETETYIYLNYSDATTVDAKGELSALKTPSGGTADVTMSENGFAFGTMTNGADVACDSATYSRPNFVGPAKAIKAVPSSLAGADYWQLVAVRVSK